jgi:hypothetical protein
MFMTVSPRHLSAGDARRRVHAQLHAGYHNEAGFPRMVRSSRSRRSPAFSGGLLFVELHPLARDRARESFAAYLPILRPAPVTPESLFSVLSARDMLTVKEYIFARKAMNSLPETARS